MCSRAHILEAMLLVFGERFFVCSSSGRQSPSSAFGLAPVVLWIGSSTGEVDETRE
jgi:hypothetical protein